MQELCAKTHTHSHTHAHTHKSHAIYTFIVTAMFCILMYPEVP